VVETDYAANKVRFLDASRFSPSPGSVEIPATIGGNVPFVRAEVGMPGGASVAGVFLLDSGTARGALLFGKSFIGLHPEFPQTGDRIDLPPVEAVGGKVEMKAGRIAFLRIRTFTFKQPIALFAPNGAGTLDNPHIDGTIGTEVLKRFGVTYDYSRSRIFLAPGDALDRAFERDASGLSPITVPPDFHRFTVSGITVHSPAADTDIRKGDILLRIDGKPAADLTLSQIRDMFALPDREYSLLIERGQQKLSVRIEARRLI